MFYGSSRIHSAPAGMGFGGATAAQSVTMRSLEFICFTVLTIRPQDDCPRGTGALLMVGMIRMLTADAGSPASL